MNAAEPLLHDIDTREFRPVLKVRHNSCNSPTGMASGNRFELTDNARHTRQNAVERRQWCISGPAEFPQIRRSPDKQICMSRTELLILGHLTTDITPRVCQRGSLRSSSLPGLYTNPTFK